MLLWTLSAISQSHRLFTLFGVTVSHKCPQQRSRVKKVHLHQQPDSGALRGACARTSGARPGRQECTVQYTPTQEVDAQHGELIHSHSPSRNLRAQPPRSARCRSRTVCICFTPQYGKHIRLHTQLLYFFFPSTTHCLIDAVTKT